MIRYILGILCFGLLGAAAVWMSGIAGFLQLTLSFFIYGSIFYLFHVAIHHVRKKTAKKYSEYLSRFFTNTSIIIGIFFLAFGYFAWYQNEHSPASMPQYHMTNGEKEIIFQSMIHIGSKDFYEQIQQEVEKAKKSGYVLFFEGVRPGTEENMDDFDQALGIQFTEDLYDNFSQLYNLTFQENNMFLGLVNNKDYNVDLSIDKIMNFYRTKRTQEKSDTTEKKENPPVDVNTEILSHLSSLNDKQKYILVYVNRAILNFITKQENLREGILSATGQEDIFSIILNERDANLAKTVHESSEEKIIILYGMMHFEGFFEILKNFDSNWEITEKKYFFPIH